MSATLRFDYVDCMRAIAALMVVVLHAADLAHHTPQISKANEWLLTPAFTLDFGRAGVVLFFAISGFVIPSSLRGAGDIVNFPIRRFFRLYPAYWLSIVVSLYVGWHLAGREPTGLQIIANFTMLQAYLGFPHVENLYWTLSVELAFYVMCYLLFLNGLVGNGAVLGGLSVLLLNYVFRCPMPADCRSHSLAHCRCADRVHEYFLAHRHAADGPDDLP